eukprot:TRINITY_DN34833_c0_g1_i1.p1 TRINITY_DN34833_c0_g1~~TRINITY_DN34833_c0_g1_i1.p1  ORF type:complete len:416 (+),score=54.98 TRINITY_DN34833_c0_g1_i1:116-1363(+)
MPTRVGIRLCGQIACRIVPPVTTYVQAPLRFHTTAVPLNVRPAGRSLFVRSLMRSTPPCFVAQRVFRPLMPSFRSEFERVLAPLGFALIDPVGPAVASTTSHDPLGQFGGARQPDMGPGAFDSVVVLCGWTYSAHSVLEKYARLYTTRGHAVIQWTRRGETIFPFPQPAQAELAQALMSFLQLFASDRYVFFHAFSNGGLCSFLHCLRLLTSTHYKPMSQQVRAVIFDSCPAQATAATASLAYTSHIANPVMRTALRSTVYGIASVIIRFCAWRAKRPMDAVVHDLFGWRLLQDSPVLHRVPSLWVYSEADRVSPFPFIDRFFTSYQVWHPEAAHAVLKLKKSPHVAHLAVYPQEYANAVNRFLVRCLDDATAAGQQYLPDGRPLPMVRKAMRRDGMHNHDGLLGRGKFVVPHDD